MGEASDRTKYSCLLILEGNATHGRNMQLAPRVPPTENPLPEGCVPLWGHRRDFSGCADTQGVSASKRVSCNGAGRGVHSPRSSRMVIFPYQHKGFVVPPPKKGSALVPAGRCWMESPAPSVALMPLAASTDKPSSLGLPPDHHTLLLQSL